MTSISSPFLGDIKECKQSMRKLRKKIYKQCVSKQKNKKSKDSTEQIIEIFKQRNVPSFVTETLKKRRSFDMTSIKNIIINAPLPLEEIRNRVNLQEKEVDFLYGDHKKRMDEEKKKQAEIRMQRLPSLNFNPSQLFSSTNQDEEYDMMMDESVLISAMEQIHSDYYSNFDVNSKEPVITDNYLHLDESNLNEDLGFLNF